MKLSPFILILPVLTLLADPAEVTMASGTRFHGDLSLMGSRPVTINTEPDKRSANRKFPASDIVRIDQILETSSMEKPWMYKEAGKVDKVYFDGEYPLLNFKTRITLVRGETVTGHILSTPFRFKGNGPKKIFLNRQLKGKTGQTVRDLDYVLTIAYSNRPLLSGKTVSGEERGKLLTTAAVVDVTRKFVYPCRVSGSSYSAENLPPGEYRTFLMTDREIIAKVGESEPIPPGLMENFHKADDFFKDRKIVHFQNGMALVFKKRSDFANAKKHVNGGSMRHLEIWYWRNVEGDWKLDSRNVVFRWKHPKERPDHRFVFQAR